MQKLRIIFTASLAILISFAAVLHSACNKSNKCNDIVCYNNGTCNKGLCVCPTGFIGSLCQTKTCDAIKCQNGGTCKDNTCICPTGYEGDLCEILQRDTLIGTYKGLDTCQSYSPVTITITAGTLNNTVTIKGLESANSVLTGTMISKNGFTVKGHTPGGYPIPIKGNGNLAGKSLMIFYSIEVGGPLTKTCYLNATKQ